MNANLEFLSDEFIMKKYKPEKIFQYVNELITEDRLHKGIETEEREHINLGIKTGYYFNNSFGMKVRAGYEGNYYTFTWDYTGQITGVVQSNYLTYFRTASLLMHYPNLHFNDSEIKILIMGSGRLGLACLSLAQHLFPKSRIFLWNRSPKPKLEHWKLYIDDSKIHYCDYPNGFFDIILTCTNSSQPLPLQDCSYRYIGVGGAVNENRKEIPRELLDNDSIIKFSDQPERAREKCGDITNEDKVNLMKEVVTDKYKVVSAFICGSGDIDVGIVTKILENERRI